MLEQVINLVSTYTDLVYKKNVWQCKIIYDYKATCFNGFNAIITNFSEWK